jgi:hypothetical protein
MIFQDLPTKYIMKISMISADIKHKMQQVLMCIIAYK